jgi:polysaccharide deacetylase 2 family uncharacterized protein YibQ
MTAFLLGAMAGALGLYLVSRIDVAGHEASIAQAPAVTPDPPAAPTVPAPAPATVAVAPAAPAPQPTVAYEEHPLPQDALADEAVPTITAPGVNPAELAALVALPPSKTWLVNALPPVDPAGRPMIAIIIDDVGVDRAHAPATIALPAPVTLSFMSYADDLASMTASARRNGHELMLHLPMEPMDPNVDSGPNSLRVGQNPDQIESELAWALGRFDGYIGVNNHMGSRFTRSAEGMTLVLAELRRRGLMFLDSRTVGDSVGAKIASELGVPNLSRDVFLDNDPTLAAIRTQLAELERIARERGYAIGIGHPYPTTVEALSAWLPELAARGIVAVPVSTILRQKLGVAG